MKKAILILGATSSIARATANEFAAKGYPLYLASRDEIELMRIATDIHLRYGVKVEYGFFDVEAFSDHSLFFEQVIKETGGLSGVLLACGYSSRHQKAIQDFTEAQKILNANFVGCCSILTYCANYFEKQKEGFIIGISSVAGDRGRQSLYLYGAAKAGLNHFLQGLRNRLFSSNVQVITIKPGFVDTPMTFGKPGMFLVASPDSIGKKIVHALDKKRNIVYLPWFWRYLMLIIKSIPECLFKRTNLQ
jgi:decaprenylphospho-beta-D-erythro-pentofuranosid-2-ulose 2-reductase